MNTRANSCGNAAPPTEIVRSRPPMRSCNFFATSVFKIGHSNLSLSVASPLKRRQPMSTALSNKLRFGLPGGSASCIAPQMRSNTRGTDTKVVGLWVWRSSPSKVIERAKATCTPRYTSI